MDERWRRRPCRNGRAAVTHPVSGNGGFRPGLLQDLHECGVVLSHGVQKRARLWTSASFTLEYVCSSYFGQVSRRIEIAPQRALCCRTVQRTSNIDSRRSARILSCQLPMLIFFPGSCH